MAGCPCISVARQQQTLNSYITNGVLTDYRGVTYDSNFGTATCQPWELNLPPYCADASGTILSNAPEWCSQSWCYINEDNCDQPVTQKTALFPGSGIRFSVGTCGGISTWDKWFGANAGQFGFHEASELAGVVEANLRTIVNTIESSIGELANSQRAGQCTASSCAAGEPCPDCRSRAGKWAGCTAGCVPWPAPGGCAVLCNAGYAFE